MKSVFISAVVLITGLFLFSWLQTPLPVTELAETSSPASMPALVMNTPAAVVPVEQPAAEESNIFPADALDQDAVTSLAQAREQGDARTPPLNPSKPRQAPGADVIADETAYATYESQQQKRMYRAYVDAALPKVRELQALIDTARQRGDIPEQDIQQAQNKINGILQMREQLLRENPDLMQPEYATSHAAADNPVPLNADGL